MLRLGWCGAELYDSITVQIVNKKVVAAKILSDSPPKTGVCHAGTGVANLHHLLFIGTS